MGTRSALVLLTRAQPRCSLHGLAARKVLRARVRGAPSRLVLAGIPLSAGRGVLLGGAFSLAGFGAGCSGLSGCFRGLRSSVNGCLVGVEVALLVLLARTAGTRIVALGGFQPLHMRFVAHIEHSTPSLVRSNRARQGWSVEFVQLTERCASDRRASQNSACSA